MAVGEIEAATAEERVTVAKLLADEACTRFTALQVSGAGRSLRPLSNKSIHGWP